jgi:hypothetical protein
MRMPVRDERTVCEVERVRSRGDGADPATCGTQQNRALVTAIGISAHWQNGKVLPYPGVGHQNPVVSFDNVTRQGCAKALFTGSVPVSGSIPNRILFFPDLRFPASVCVSAIRESGAEVGMKRIAE